MVLPDDLNMVYRARICRKCDVRLRWTVKTTPYVVIENGQLVTGVIDEKGLQAFAGKMLDQIVKEYGSEAAREFLDSPQNWLLPV